MNSAWAGDSFAGELKQIPKTQQQYDMPQETDPHRPHDPYIIAPQTAKEAGKVLPGLHEAHIAAQILNLIASLPKGTAGVDEIRAGAVKLAHAASEKLGKAK